MILLAPPPEILIVTAPQLRVAMARDQIKFFELAALLGVSRQAVANWRNERVPIDRRTSLSLFAVGLVR